MEIENNSFLDFNTSSAGPGSRNEFGSINNNPGSTSK